MTDLDRAIAIAVTAHAGQSDKAGQPYILHPIRLMLRFQNEEEMIVAILHDVIEDTSLTADHLRENGFSETVISAVESLTKREEEAYEDFIMRLSNNELSRKIKIEDIRDNLDLTRLENITDKDLARAEKYHRALMYLTRGGGYLTCNR